MLKAESLFKNLTVRDHLLKVMLLSQLIRALKSLRLESFISECVSTITGSLSTTPDGLQPKLELFKRTAAAREMRKIYESQK